MPVHDDADYKKEERIVYVTGYDRHMPFVDLENFLKKYGDILKIQQKLDLKGRSKGFVFVEYKDKEHADAAVAESGRANLMGRRLTINYKMSKVKAVQVDRDCWFCLANPNVSIAYVLYDYLD